MGPPSTPKGFGATECSDEAADGEGLEGVVVRHSDVDEVVRLAE